MPDDWPAPAADAAHISSRITLTMYRRRQNTLKATNNIEMLRLAVLLFIFILTFCYISLPYILSPI